MKIAVLDGRQLEDLNRERLNALGEVEWFSNTPADEVVRRAKDAEVVLLNKVRLTRPVLEQLSALRYVGVLATGYDNVDTAAAQEFGITVTNAPGYATDSVAQTIFALLLELCHRAGAHSNGVIRERKWSGQPYYSYWDSPLTELKGKTLGIVGMGRIGRKTAQIARAFGMNVAAYSRTQREIEGVEWHGFDELLRISDVVTTCCPLNDQTLEMMNEAAFAKMKRTAFYVNTARGGVVEEAALRRALDEGWIAGAAIDVMTSEPPRADNCLLDAKNIVITPHIAWATREARKRLLDIVCDNLAAWQAGRPENTVY